MGNREWGIIEVSEQQKTSSRSWLLCTQEGIQSDSIFISLSLTSPVIDSNLLMSANSAINPAPSKRKMQIEKCKKGNFLKNGRGKRDWKDKKEEF